MAIRSISGDTLMSDFLHKCGGVALIDGGLATELERYGADLNDPLWSAKCLVTSTHLIRQVHLDYLEAGADIIITASYQQATIQGFEAKGYSSEDGESMLRKSVEIACEARDLYYQICRDAVIDYTDDGRIFKHRPILVAASVGSYGAYLADGSEYSGDYGDAMDLEFLKGFHRRRVQVLAESGADLISFETIPNKLEAQAFSELLEEGINIPAWFAFNSKDGVNVVGGDSLAECARIADSCKKVVAVGINCTPPRFIGGLISKIKKVTNKPILVYPNSGERYDAQLKQWMQNTGVAEEDFVSYVNRWCEMGASLVGGCCRTTPDTIRAIYRTLPSRSVPTPVVENVQILITPYMDTEANGENASLVLIKQGAEARVFESTFAGRKSIVKERFSKKYRHPTLDSKLTLKRLNAEARCMTKARRLGVSTPVLYAVDPISHTLTFEYVEGPSIKDIFLEFGIQGVVEEKMDDIALQIGDTIGKLHDGGVIHGDLTTSNMLWRSGSNQLVLIDFGLSFVSTLPEDKAVDLYVLERALLSMHSSCGNVMDKILAAYRKSSKQWSSTFNKLGQVRLRGRKRSMIG
ncbi:hypothetical protein E3N88_33781 [Mikania micrantha]|uniref:non-specific serine/threonine protein kinase n=1 Tax=Mikania micrantha TaxID=192012 RepID=A0A5N6MCI2_9ASTR|nr:hypothetical protein E3N88_33781 [Mikania micrantha]